jgi:predicted MPP superfamily phosphohydrolase
MKRLMRRKLVIGFIVLIGAVLFSYYQNNFIGVTNINLELERLPQEFEGLKIVQVSDLHSKSFGENQYKLVDKIKRADPDLIFITGDMVDSKNYDEQAGLTLIDELTGTAPIYFVTGNHEFWSGEFSSLEKKLQERGVKILRGAVDTIERNGGKIDIIGVDDPSAMAREQYIGEGKVLSDELEEALKETDEQTIKLLLSHRPELLSTYAEHNIDLIFSGHAHGGQVRLPLIGGLVAPNQGFLPKYTSGKYIKEHSVMIVSRGLGNSIIPQRIFNRPEIVAVRLSGK